MTPECVRQAMREEAVTAGPTITCHYHMEGLLNLGPGTVLCNMRIVPTIPLLANNQLKRIHSFVCTWGHESHI